MVASWFKTPKPTRQFGHLPGFRSFMTNPTPWVEKTTKLPGDVTPNGSEKYGNPPQMAKIQEISNRTHVSRTPKKPEYLIARSQLTERGPLVRSHSVFDGQKSFRFRFFFGKFAQTVQKGSPCNSFQPAFNVIWSNYSDLTRSHPKR